MFHLCYFSWFFFVKVTASETEDISMSQIGKLMGIKNRSSLMVNVFHWNLTEKDFPMWQTKQNKRVDKIRREIIKLYCFTLIWRCFWSGFLTDDRIQQNVPQKANFHPILKILGRCTLVGHSDHHFGQIMSWRCYFNPRGTATHTNSACNHSQQT